MANCSKRLLHGLQNMTLLYYKLNKSSRLFTYLLIGFSSSFSVVVLNSFYRATACNATHGIAVAILSVRPSVRPSVRQMRVL